MKLKIQLLLVSILLLLFSCTGIKNGGVFHKKVKSSSEVKASEVPANLIEAFQEKYPNCIAEEWYRMNNYKYAVSFKKDGIYKYAYFTNFGIFQEEEINEELYYDPYDEYEWEEMPEEYY